jgi:hypothetical protein
MKRKETTYKGLDIFDVFFNDTSLTSPDVFQITEFPTRLTAGKNLIKLKGHPTNLRIGSYLNIEILDFNGDPVYYEVVNYLDEDKSRIIAIYVYDETSPGTATITLLGELNEINGQSVPLEWEGRSNVRWSRTVEVNPTISNDSEIIFETLPSASLTEQVGVQLDRTYPNNQQFPTYTTGTVRYFSYNNTPAFEISGGLFTQEMEGGTITVSSPVNPTPTPQYTPSTTTYETTVRKVLSDTLMLLDDNFTVASPQSIFTHTYTQFDYSSFSITYEADPVYTPTQNSESFANISLYGLQPAAGDVSRIKIFLNGNGSIGTWEQINDIELEETELFIDEANVFPNFRIGAFTSQSVIDTYWESNYYSGFVELSAPTLTWTSSSMANAVQVITGSSGDITAYNQVYTFQTKTAYAATFVSESSYKITIDAIGTRSAVSGNNNPKLSVFLSGSAFLFDETDILNQELPTKLGVRVGELEVTSNSQRFDDTVFEFEAPATGTAQLIFVIESGEWTFSDIRTTTDNDAGYTPAYSKIRTEIPTKHKSSNQYRFRIDYFNVDGVKSRQSTYINNVDWQGGNRYIDGEYSMITGSLYVADTLETGIAISGLKDTGFVRSLGYSGFEYGDPGFLLWSGSALSGSSGTKGGVPYTGVGLELYANTDNYFRFSTTDSELDVRTQKFFVGNATTFLSGSDGNLQIKSGNDLNIYNGEITGSNVLISNTIKTSTSTTEDYIVLSTAERVVDASNIARIVYQDESLSQDTQHTTAVSSPYTSSNVLLASFTCNILPGETNMVFMFQVSGSISGSSSQILGSINVDPYLKIDLSYISASAGPVETFATSPNFRIITPIETLETYEFSGSMHDGFFGTRLSNGPTFFSGDFVQMYKPINGDMQGKFVKVDIYERLRIFNNSGTGTTSGSLNWRNLHVMTTRQANEFQSIGLAEAVEAPQVSEIGLGGGE